MGIAFGDLVPCRACHGHGERVIASTKEELAAHARLKRRDPDIGRIPASKPCPDCAGKGFVPIPIADGTSPLRRAR